MKNVVIVGGGATGWTVASLLAKQWPRELVKIHLVDDKRCDNNEVDFARSGIHRFHDLVGLREQDCLHKSNASFSLGILSRSPGKDYMLVEGPYGAPLDTIDFQSLYYKSVLLNSPYKLEDYSLSAVAARSGRFCHPVNDPKSIYSTLRYGLHLELNSYANILKSRALELGVKIIEGDCLGVNVSGLGEIESLVLVNGQQLTADFFIDCSGEQSLLLGSALGVGSVTDPLGKIFDSLAMGYRPLVTGARPVAELVQSGNGYLKVIPLKDREYVCYLYSSTSTNDENIKCKMRELNVTDVIVSPLGCQTKELFWAKNCVAIGQAAVNVYDLFVSPLSLVRNAVVRLVDLLADFDDFSVSASEYNRLTQIELERLRELTEIYLYLDSNSSLLIEEYFKQHPLTGHSRHRLDLFACSGRHVHQQVNIFSEGDWAALFVGNSLLPEACNVDADNYDPAKLVAFAERVRIAIYKAAEKMPLHADYMARIYN